MPVISVDADMANIPSLEACLLASVPFFERLSALIVVAVSPTQKSLLSEQIRERFEFRMMEELDVDSVRALVERRIGMYSNEPYQMTAEEAEKVLAASKNGHPGSIIKVLRSVIDGQILPDIAPNQISEPLLEEELHDDPSKSHDMNIFSQEDEDIEGQATELPNELEEDDASSLDEWEDGPGMSGAIGFDLNLEILEEPIIEEEKEEPIPDTYVTEDSLPSVGSFGGLRDRWKETSQSIKSADEPEGEYEPMDEANSLWVSKDLLDVKDAPKVELLEHEEPPQEVHELNESLEIQDQIMIDDNDLIQNESMLKTLTNLLSQLLSPSANQTVSNNLAENLQALSRPKIGEKAEHSLNVMVLTSLTQSESIVVSVAQQRTVSPSDKLLLEKLNIKRARLSQICNRLHKAGILDVRMVGRSRMFGLTRTALAQMMAWGLVGGDV